MAFFCSPDGCETIIAAASAYRAFPEDPVVARFADFYYYYNYYVFFAPLFLYEFGTNFVAIPLHLWPFFI
jgi:hypothetical protein